MCGGRGGLCEGELRFITIGRSGLLRVLFVVHLEIARSGRTRIISARKASPSQRRKYEEG